MSIARILVPIRGDGKGENILAHAAALARRHNAHITAIHCRARPRDMIPYGVVVPGPLRRQIEEQAIELADAEERRLKELFLEAVRDLGLALSDDGVPPRDRPTASWHEEQGKQADIIKSFGRLTDLVAVAKPDRDRNLGVNSLKAALFNTGRPVLLCPPAEARPEALGARLAIAWNGSMQAARAVALTLPLLQEAEDVLVLDGGIAPRGATGEDLLTYLAIRGVEARREALETDDNAGPALLDGARSAGADTLIMGAYSHSREHETIFGGTTQHVVDKGAIPVIMVH